MTTVIISLNFDNFSCVNKNNYGKRHNLHLGSYLAKLDRAFTAFSVEIMR